MKKIAYRAFIIYLKQFVQKHKQFLVHILFDKAYILLCTYLHSWKKIEAFYNYTR